MIPLGAAAASDLQIAMQLRCDTPSHPLPPRRRRPPPRLFSESPLASRTRSARDTRAPGQFFEFWHAARSENEDEGDENRWEKDRNATLSLPAYCVCHLPAHFVHVELDLQHRRVGHKHCQDCLGLGGTDVVPAQV